MGRGHTWPVRCSPVRSRSARAATAGAAAWRAAEHPGTDREDRYTAVARVAAGKAVATTSVFRGGLSSTAEHRIVAPKVTGSKPVGHPNSPLVSEQHGLAATGGRIARDRDPNLHR